MSFWYSSHVNSGTSRDTAKKSESAIDPNHQSVLGPVRTGDLRSTVGVRASGECGHRPIRTGGQSGHDAAAETGATIMSVDYRLAPEHPFPAAVEDALSAVIAAAARADDLGVDANRLFVAGDSAGAVLALVAALTFKNGAGPRISGVIAVYPSTDFANIGKTKSYRLFGGGALVFLGALAIVVVLYLTTRISRVALFWLAFILTRPLGATVGDFLDKPIAKGGLNLDRFSASAVLVVFIIACILLIPQRAGGHPGASDKSR